MAKKTSNPKGKSSSVKRTASAKRVTPELHGTRRPSQNPILPNTVLNSVYTELNRVKAVLEEYAVHLRPLDRKRLNGIGLITEGFIERSSVLALENPQFLPKYLPTEKMETDHQLYLSLRSLYDISKQSLDIHMEDALAGGGHGLYKLP